jgi:KUP system potassium uptake protein
MIGRISPGVSRRTAAGAALTALGVVYGDLGTSPLYTLQTVIAASGGHLTAEAGLGILSLLVWALIVTISVKYCLFVMRADNHGEGGILALMSLLGVNRAASGGAYVLVCMGLFGAALIYGDGIITPAISVLSALEGVNVATTALKPFVVPMALAILLGLFAAQAIGTARIGRVFGPIMSLWFGVIALIGLAGVMHHPAVIAAIDPRHAVRFLILHGWGSFAVLGGVFLAITGGEALYADMGHIGKNPIRKSWYCIVLPALLLSYAGQIAFLADHPDATGNPFFLIAPKSLIYPLVFLATLATIIASQAIITGSFSLTRQAMQLGWLPGLAIRQTSDEEYGQIYVPFVNWTMMICTMVLTLAFGSSDRLAGAYGTAVSTTMLLTTVLLYKAMRDRWGWSIALAASVAGIFAVVDAAFFAANLLKIAAGGWIPLVFGTSVFLLMTTWRQGVDAVRNRQARDIEHSEAFASRLEKGGIPRVPGSAVFLTHADSAVPLLLQHHVDQIGAVQETIIAMTVRFEEVPRVSRDDRAEVVRVADAFWHVTVHFGFIEIPDLSSALACAREKGCELDLGEAMYFGAHDEIIRSDERPRLRAWRRHLFAFMHRNGLRAVERFDLPSDRFIEEGRQVAV